jgi:hypothetical protein
LVTFGFAAFGCNDPIPAIPSPPPAPSSELGGHFDPSTAGSIVGQVTWTGNVPTSSSFELFPVPGAGEILGHKQVRPNPNLPRIGAAGGVANAVVHLRQIGPEDGKLWDLPPVSVETRDCQFRLIQGAAVSSVGFVRRGEAVSFMSRDNYFHAVHADGATFWNFAFPDPGSPLVPRLTKKGVIELSSAAGYFWMRAYLFVDDHPYYARTDSSGRFLLAQVPPGCYEIVCWLPDWREARHERDPESGMISRLYFRPSLESVQSVTVRARNRVEVHFSMSTGS